MWNIFWKETIQCFPHYHTKRRFGFSFLIVEGCVSWVLASTFLPSRWRKPCGSHLCHRYLVSKLLAIKMTKAKLSWLDLAFRDWCLYCRIDLGISMLAKVNFPSNSTKWIFHLIRRQFWVCHHALVGVSLNILFRFQYTPSHLPLTDHLNYQQSWEWSLAIVASDITTKKTFRFFHNLDFSESWMDSQLLPAKWLGPHHHVMVQYPASWVS